MDRSVGESVVGCEILGEVEDEKVHIWGKKGLAIVSVGSRRSTYSVLDRMRSQCRRMSCFLGEYTTTD